MNSYEKKENGGNHQLTEQTVTYQQQQIYCITTLTLTIQLQYNLFNCSVRIVQYLITNDRVTLIR